MSRVRPLTTEFPLRAVKYIAMLRREKIDAVPQARNYVGLEQIQSWTGRLAEAGYASGGEGAANLFWPGDVLFSKLRPYLAKGWLADHDGFCTTEALVLRPLGDARFLRYSLLTKEVIDSIDSSTYGAKMPRADWGFIGNLELPFPAESVQRAIANYLDAKTAAIDALIAKKEKLLGLLDRYRQAVIAEAVGRGVRHSTSLVKSGIPWAPLVPSHWKICKLKTALASVSSGGTPNSGVDANWSDEGTNWVAIGDMSSVDEVSATEKRVSALGLHEKNLTILPVGTLLYSIYASLGHVAELRIPAATNQAILALVPNRKACPRYLFWFLKATQPTVDAYASYGTQANLNAEKVKNLPLLLPPMAEQSEIAEHLDRRTAEIAKLSNKALEQVEALRKYRASLVAAAVTGKLDIPTP